jgi:hypothetical protein
MRVSPEGISMATVRIFRDQFVGSPVLHNHRSGWRVRFETEMPQHADPLTGWAGGAETQSQVNLMFPSKEAAIAYCQKHGHKFTVQDGPPRKLLLQSYSDNFR